MKTYYLIDLVNRMVLSGGPLPETFGLIFGWGGFTDEMLADLTPYGSENLGFMTHDGAVAFGADAASLAMHQSFVFNSAWRLIEAERDFRQGGGFFADGYWWHSGEAERTQYSTFISLALEKNLPPEFVLMDGWKTMTGELIPMTVARCRAIRDAGIELAQALFLVGQSHRDAMVASPDPFAYDFSAGWPLRFGESA